MSELQGLKKAELSEVSHRLGIHTLTKDTKKVLIEKITDFIAKNPAENIIAVQAALDAEISHEEKVKQNEIKKAASEVVEEEDDEDDEDEDDEDDEEEADDDDQETVVAGDDDDEEEDKDYTEGPPISLQAYVVDPALEFFEESYSKLLEFTDSIGVTTADFNGELRETLSKSVTLNYGEALLELGIFLYNFVKFAPIKKNSSFPIPFLKDSVISDVSVPDIYASLDQTTIYTFIVWTLLSVVSPLIISYYINFTRRLITFDDETEIFARIYKYDPFIFAVSKLVIIFFLGATVHHEYTIGNDLISVVYHHSTLFLDSYQKFTILLGNLPYVIGIANAAVALYSQFEEY